MQAPSISAFAALAFACGSVLAQTQAPGLWENNVTIKTQSGEMEKAMAQMQAQMAAMPPEQRKAVEQMMASRGVGMSPKGTSVRVCVTKEDIERRNGPQMGSGNCTQEVVQRTSNSMKMKWQCTGANPSTGEGEITFSSDKAYTGKAVMTTTVKGKPEQMNVDTAGHWVAGDCGDIKPRSAPKP